MHPRLGYYPVLRKKIMTNRRGAYGMLPTVSNCVLVRVQISGRPMIAPTVMFVLCSHFHTYIIIIFLTNLINGGIIHLLNALTETVAKKKDLKRVGDGVSPTVSLL